METRILEKAASEISARVPECPLVAGVERPAPSCFDLILDGPAGRFRLTMDVHPEHPTFHLSTTGREERDPSAGGFAERLHGTRIVAIESGSEPRVRRLRFSPRRVLGPSVANDPAHSRESDAGGWDLIVEWTGRGGNIRLVDAGGIVAETLRPGGPRGGEAYRAPEPDRRPPLSELDASALSASLSDLPRTLWPRAILRACRDVAMEAAVDATIRAEIPEELAEILLEHAVTRERTPAAAPRLYLFPRRAALPRQSPPAPGAETAAPPGGTPAASGAKAPAAHLTAAEAGLPAAAVADTRYPALAEFLDPAEEPLMELLARAHRARVIRREQEIARTEALRRIRMETSRLLRLRDHLIRERGSDDQGNRLRRSGEAILSNMHRIRKGDAEVVCPDWSAEDAPPLRITLDPAKPPADSAQNYFRQARRWERGEPHRRKRMELIDRAVAKLSVVRTRVEDSDSPPRATAIDTWIADASGVLARGRSAPVAPGADRAGSSHNKGAGGSGRTGVARASGTGAGASGSGRPGHRDPAAGFRPRSFTTREGWTVLVGRSNAENDYLTHRLAHPEDLWFHAHGVPGSHVVLRREGRKSNPSARTIEEVASIAAFYSKARHSGKVPVIYTLRKYVRKPRQGKPGLALCMREKSVLVPPRDPTEGQEPEWMEE